MDIRKTISKPLNIMKIYSKHRSDYKKLLPGADDLEIDTSKMKASAQEIETLET